VGENLVIKSSIIQNRSIISEIYEHTYLRREVRSTYLDNGIRKNGTCNSTNGRVPKSFPRASREGEWGGGWTLLLSFFNRLAGVWSASRPGCSTAGKRAPGIHRTEDQVGPRASPDVWRREDLLSLPDIESRFPGRRTAPDTPKSTSLSAGIIS